MTAKRPGYREAVEWIANNDDCFWTLDDNPTLSVTSSLVRDLWGKDDATVHRDVLRKWKEIYPEARRGF